MSKDNTEKLYSEFEKLLKEGNDADLKVFLRDNLEKFPEELQNKITVLLLKKALQDVVKEKGSDENAIKRFQRAGIATLKKLENIGEELENKKEELLVQESLNKSKN